MAVQDYISIQNITTIKGTTPDNPLITGVSLGWCLLNSVFVRIPPGHGGVTGWALELDGNRVIPWQQDGAWITGDDEQFSELLNLELDTGLTIVTYNQSNLFSHTHYARLHYTPIANVGAAVAPITLISMD